MMQDSRNVIPVSMAVLLHVLLFGSLLVVLDFRDRTQPLVPLAIKGTIVTEIPQVVVPPKAEEAPPPEPTIGEQERIEAEQEKRREDERIEQQRLSRIAEQEAKRKAEEEAARRKAEEVAKRQRLAEEEQRRKEEEAEKERQRLEAERKREEEIERQRKRNEQLREEAEAQRSAALAAESSRLEAMTANAEAAYMFAIQQRISRNWVRPATATAGLECVVNIQQLPGGEVASVSLGACNGDSAVRRSIEAAVRRASPLPTPADSSVFDRNIRLTFRPED